MSLVNLIQCGFLNHIVQKDAAYAVQPKICVKMAGMAIDAINQVAFVFNQILLKGDNMRYKKDRNWLAIIAISACVLMVGALITLNIIVNTTVSYEKFTVTGKERVTSDGSSKYLVYTNTTTFEVVDTWIHWRFDSSDFYGKIVVGKTYQAKVQGWRVPFFSMYQNIITLDESSQ